MVIEGIGWEYALRLYQDGFARIPDMDAPYERHDQYGVKVNPIAAAKIMDDMLSEAGVTLYYGQPLVNVTSSRDRIREIQIATKDGLLTLTAEIYIDCTGDGDLAHLAGATTEDGDGNGTFQPGTLRFLPCRSCRTR
ncbi:MAG: FAD-dependent oxidoreductase [Clostridia bacterium]|nr:FAD-dependent oxidoreductase [Clostridia bacterium]